MEYLNQVQLIDYNSFKTEAVAKIFCKPNTIDQLKKSLTDFRDEKKLIIGGGCNILFTENFDGLVIHPSLKGYCEIHVEGNSEEAVYIEAMASEDWDEFVAYCVERGFSGLENLSHIPGTVGASPIQNIGAYGAEVKDTIHEVIALNMETGETIRFSNEECVFSYRDSLFKQTNKYIITSVVFRLQRKFSYIPKYAELNRELEYKPNPTIKDVRKAVIRIRQRKLPDEKVLPNAGSFFKNPYLTKQQADDLLSKYPDLPVYPQKNGLIKTSAAYLIDKSGYKGKRHDDIGTYPGQPLIIVNYGSKDGKEVVRFMREIQTAVEKTFGIKLDPEVRIF